MENSKRESSLSFGGGKAVKATFKKNERLSKEKWIQELFEKGSSFYLYPFKVIYRPHPDSTQPNQVLISVSSRQFRKAVDRNLVKRRIREAYRTQKMAVKLPALIFALIYTAKEILPFQEVKNKTRIALTKLGTLAAPPATPG